MPTLTRRIHDSIHTATGWLKAKLDPASHARLGPTKLALIFGERETSVRYIQIICLSACCALLFLIGVELLPLAAAAIAGMLAAFSPHFSYYLVMLSPESLASLPLLLAVYFLVRAYKRPHIGYLLAAAERQPVEMILPFASDDAGEIRAVVLGRPGLDGQALRIGAVELFEVGPTSALWTTYPRAAIRALQKNVFKTQRLLLLNILGIALLVMARRRAALLTLLAVPLYYLLVQSAFHTEYRYTLAIHYFLFSMGATAIYSIIAGLRELLSAGLRYSSNDKRI
jgi:Dolichyl-phosphate-mannose-protein mannosyltransferase